LPIFADPEDAGRRDVLIATVARFDRAVFAPPVCATQSLACGVYTYEAVLQPVNPWSRVVMEVAVGTAANAPVFNAPLGEGLMPCEPSATIGTLSVAPGSAAVARPASEPNSVSEVPHDVPKTDTGMPAPGYGIPPPPPPEYCGMFKTPALNVAGPLEPAVVMDWTGTCVVEGVPLICVKGIEGKSAATRAHGANAVAVPQVPITSWLVCPVAAARASTGVVVELVTLGVSQLSHEPVEKLSTVARDVPHVGQLIVLPLTTIGDDPV
jgi:hypothetical protein